MKYYTLFLAFLVSYWMQEVVAANDFTVMSPAQFLVSQPMSAGIDDSKTETHKVHKLMSLPKHVNDKNQDDALQTEAGQSINTNNGGGINFPGVSALGYAPPDTNMAVGPNHILQTVNSLYAIYNKSGNLLVGPNSLSSLWAPLGSSNGCAINNSGDVVAQYDKLADRFIVTQMGGVIAPFSECIAISKTSDPLGAYWLYSYSFGTTMNDYPKFGIWSTSTNSAYLATYNLFANGSSFTGAQLCAYDRTKMLAGNPTAQSICYTINGDFGYLPADLDGSTPPLAGTPGYFLNYETLGSLRMYMLAPNFANPNASTLTVQTPDIPVASFAEACGGGTCIPQSGTTQLLDSVGDRLMYRLAFRNFGDHEAMVINHSVAVGSSVGIRWYELQAPVSSTSAFSLYQQGTYAPDLTYRWMGSAAMDGVGNIAIGYSASSSSMHPAIRYTARAPGDTLGTLRTEVSMIEGAGSQTGGLSRWGDYSAMRIDPADDCTFWYTNEYLLSNGAFNWNTFFGSFKLSGCGTPDFSISANPTSLSLTQGTQGTYAITVASLSGFNSAVNLAVTGCPPNATCTVTNPVTPPANGQIAATLTVNSATAAVGSYPLTITGTNGSLIHSTLITLIVNGSPDFTLSATPLSKSLKQGTQGTYAITVASLSGFNSAVNLAVTGCPPNATCTVTNPVTPPANGQIAATLTVNSATAAVGSYPLTITGTNGSLIHSTLITLIVNGSPDFTLSANPASNTVTRGSSTSYSINIKSVNGFNSAVRFSVIGLPTNVSTIFTPSSVTGSGNSSMKITVKRGVPIVTNLSITVKGASGALSHSQPLTLTIQ